MAQKYYCLIEDGQFIKLVSKLLHNLTLPIKETTDWGARGTPALAKIGRLRYNHHLQESAVFGSDTRLHEWLLYVL